MIHELIKSSFVRSDKVLFPLDNQIVIDSRKCSQGDFFIAIPGKHYDGHDFLTEVADIPVSGALIEERFFVRAVSDIFDKSHNQYWWQKIPIVMVSDTRKALLELASVWRRRYDFISAVVIGSNGKTTVKEMVASIFKKAVGPSGTLASMGNFNNDIGLPLSLLRLRKNIVLAVFEVGMNHPGETFPLVKAAGPQVLLINNAQREHQEHMKSVLAVAKEHASAIASLDDSGVVIIPSEDRFSHVWRKAAGKRRIIEFSLKKTSIDSKEIGANRVIGYLHASSIANENFLNRFLYQELEIRSKTMNFIAKIHVAGIHSALNAVAAASIGVACNLNEDSIREGLESFRPLPGRLHQTLLQNPPYDGVVLIDDTYNANPDSVYAAIDVITSRRGKRIMIFGDMGEVGERVIEEHYKIGLYAAYAGIDVLFTIGINSQYAWSAFCSARRSVYEGGHFACYKTLLNAIHNYFFLSHRQGCLMSLLVKGSRFMEMNRLIHQLSSLTNV